MCGGFGRSINRYGGRRLLEDDGPSCVSVDTTTDGFLIEEVNEDGLGDLGDPVADIFEVSI